MAAAVKSIPDDRRSATPYLAIRDAGKALEFYEKAFDAVVVVRFPMPDGRVGHAEIKIGDAVVMLSDEYPDMDVLGPESLGGSGSSVHIYVEDVDAFIEQAIAAGASAMGKIEDQFYGDRTGKIKDPFGHVWWVATHIEDVSPEDMQSRAKALFG